MRIEFVWKSNENISSFKLKGQSKRFYCAIFDMFLEKFLVKVIPNVYKDFDFHINVTFKLCLRSLKMAKNKPICVWLTRIKNTE